MRHLPIDLTLWVVPPLISCLTLFFLAALTIAKGKGRKVTLLFAAICFLGGLLSLDKAFAAIITDPNLALKISRLDHVFVVFFIPIYLHFTLSFLGARNRKWLVAVAYGFSAVLSLFSQSNYHLAGVRHFFFGYYALGGPLIYVFGVATTVNTLYCIYLLVRHLKTQTEPDRKNKTKYIIFGLGAAAFIAHFDLLPLAGISFYPLGNLAFIPILFLAFAVLKHDLLEIGLVFQKGLIYSLLTGLLTTTYGLAIILFNEGFKDLGQKWSILFSVLFFAVIVFVFEPLKRRLQTFIDRVLFKDKYNYHATLRDLSGAMTTILDLDEIMAKALQTLTNTMHLEWGYVMLMDDLGDEFHVRCFRGGPAGLQALSLQQSSPIVAALRARKREITRPDLAGRSGSVHGESPLWTAFSRLGGAVVIPMVFKADINGILVLGNKKSGDLYTARDLELLGTLANQCAIAIENAKAYRVIENLNINLEAMVEKRTADLQEALNEKEKTQELLVRAESLAAVGALVAGVAHELNNPLASVSSLVQSAVETLESRSEHRPPSAFSQGRGDTEELTDDLRFSLKELRRARDIVSSLLGISRQTQEYTEPVLLNDVSKDALRILFNQYKRTGIELTEDYASDLPAIRGNFANLGQVCLNVLTNAIQVVNPDSGKIFVKTGYDRAKARVLFECADNGPGISRHVIKDIFKPFFTTKEVGKGTGLGLYLSHEIVRRHGGDIMVTNRAQGGTRFCVSFPVT